MASESEKNVDVVAVETVTTKEENLDEMARKRETESSMDENIDRISQMPEDIIHKFMCLISTKDVTRTAVLSRTFHAYWRSFPVFNFDQDMFEEKRCCTYKNFGLGDLKILNDTFLDYMMHCIQSSQIKVSIPKFRVNVRLGSNILRDERVNRAIDFPLENNVSELDIDIFFSVGRGGYYCLPDNFSSQSIVILRLTGFRLNIEEVVRSCPSLEQLRLNDCKSLKDDVTFSSGSKLRTIELEYCLDLKRVEINSNKVESLNYSMKDTQSEIVLSANSLKSLILENRNITDKWIYDELLELDHLESLILKGCNGLTSTRISNDKLKILEVLDCERLMSLEVGDPNLQSFVFRGHRNTFCDIDIRSCHLLEHVTLGLAYCVTDHWLSKLLRVLCNLKSLILEGCVELKYIEVASRELKSLSIIHCYYLKSFKVECAKLVSFTYIGEPVRCLLMNAPRLANATLSFNCSHDWVALKNLLVFFGHCKVLSLCFDADEFAIFPEEIRDWLLPPLYDLKTMKTKVRGLTRVNPALVEGLLWLAPNLETLSFETGSAEKSIKFVYGKIEDEGLDMDFIYCCRDKPIKCWRHELKHVEMINFEDNEENNSLLKFFSDECRDVQGIYVEQS